MKSRHVLAALALTVAVATSASAQTVGIGTSPTGTLNNSIGTALGKVLGDETGINARVVPYGGDQQFLPLINSKQLELAIPTSDNALFAYEGQGVYNGHPNGNLRAIGTVFPFTIGWFVKKDSPYKSLTELKGKKVAVGFTASNTQRTAVLATMAAYGLDESDFDGVPVAHVVRGADDFAQGKVEASSFAVGAGKVAEVDVKVGGIRFLNMPTTPDAEARIKKIMPTAYISSVQPAPHLAGILAPTDLMFTDYVVLAGTHVSDEVAYNIAKVLYERQDKLVKIVKTWGDYKKERLPHDAGIPFHPGAIKFYTEKGMWPPKS